MTSLSLSSSNNGDVDSKTNSNIKSRNRAGIPSRIDAAATVSAAAAAAAADSNHNHNHAQNQDSRKKEWLQLDRQASSALTDASSASSAASAAAAASAASASSCAASSASAAYFNSNSKSDSVAGMVSEIDSQFHQKRRKWEREEKEQHYNNSNSNSNNSDTEDYSKHEEDDDENEDEDEDEDDDIPNIFSSSFALFSGGSGGGNHADHADHNSLEDEELTLGTYEDNNNTNYTSTTNTAAPWSNNNNSNKSFAISEVDSQTNKSTSFAYLSDIDSLTAASSKKSKSNVIARGRKQQQQQVYMMDMDMDMALSVSSPQRNPNPNDKLPATTQHHHHQLLRPSNILVPDYHNHNHNRTSHLVNLGALLPPPPTTPHDDLDLDIDLGIGGGDHDHDHDNEMMDARRQALVLLSDQQQQDDGENEVRSGAATAATQRKGSNTTTIKNRNSDMIMITPEASDLHHGNHPHSVPDHLHVVNLGSLLPLPPPTTAPHDGIDIDIDIDNERIMMEARQNALFDPFVSPSKGTSSRRSMSKDEHHHHQHPLLLPNSPSPHLVNLGTLLSPDQRATFDAPKFVHSPEDSATTTTTTATNNHNHNMEHRQQQQQQDDVAVAVAVTPPEDAPGVSDSPYHVYPQGQQRLLDQEKRKKKDTDHHAIAEVWRQECLQAKQQHRNIAQRLAQEELRHRQTKEQLKEGHWEQSNLQQQLRVLLQQRQQRVQQKEEIIANTNTNRNTNTSAQPSKEKGELFSLNHPNHQNQDHSDDVLLLQLARKQKDLEVAREQSKSLIRDLKRSQDKLFQLEATKAGLEQSLQHAGLTANTLLEDAQSKELLSQQQVDSLRIDKEQLVLKYEDSVLQVQERSEQVLCTIQEELQQAKSQFEFEFQAYRQKVRLERDEQVAETELLQLKHVEELDRVRDELQDANSKLSLSRQEIESLRVKTKRLVVEKENLQATASKDVCDVKEELEQTQRQLQQAQSKVESCDQQVQSQVVEHEMRQAQHIKELHNANSKLDLSRQETESLRLETEQLVAEKENVQATASKDVCDVKEELEQTQRQLQQAQSKVESCDQQVQSQVVEHEMRQAQHIKELHKANSKLDLSRQEIDALKIQVEHVNSQSDSSRQDLEALGSANHQLSADQESLKVQHVENLNFANCECQETQAQLDIVHKEKEDFVEWMTSREAEAAFIGQRLSIARNLTEHKHELALSGLQQQSDGMSTERKELQRQVVSLQITINELETEKQATSAQFDEEAQTVNCGLVSTEDHSLAIKQREVLVDNEMELLKMEKKQVSQALIYAQEDNLSLRNSIQSLQAETLSLQSSVAGISGELSQAQAKAKKASFDSQESQAKLQQTHNLLTQASLKAAGLESKLASSAENSNSFLTERDLLSIENEGLKASHLQDEADVENIRRCNVSLVEQVSVLQNHNARTQSERTSTEEIGKTTMSELEKDCVNTKRLHEEALISHAILENSLQDKISKTVELQTQVVLLKKESEEKVFLHGSAIETLLFEKVAINDELNVMTQRIVSSDEKLQDANTEVRNVKQRLKVAASELLSQLDAAQSEKSTLKSLVKKLSRQMAKLKSELSRCRKERDELLKPKQIGNCDNTSTLRNVGTVSPMSETDLDSFRNEKSSLQKVIDVAESERGAVAVRESTVELIAKAKQDLIRQRAKSFSFRQSLHSSEPNLSTVWNESGSFEDEFIRNEATMQSVDKNHGMTTAQKAAPEVQGLELASKTKHVATKQPRKAETDIPDSPTKKRRLAPNTSAISNGTITPPREPPSMSDNSNEFDETIPSRNESHVNLVDEMTNSFSKQPRKERRSEAHQRSVEPQSPAVITSREILGNSTNIIPNNIFMGSTDEPLDDTKSIPSLSSPIDVSDDTGSLSSTIVRVYQMDLELELHYRDKSLREQFYTAKAKYTGPLLGHMPHGPGMLRFDCGDMYLGDFDRGEMHGVGAFAQKCHKKHVKKVFLKGNFSHNEFRGGAGVIDGSLVAPIRRVRVSQTSSMLSASLSAVRGELSLSFSQSESDLSFVDEDSVV